VNYEILKLMWHDLEPPLR